MKNLRYPLYWIFKEKDPCFSGLDYQGNQLIIAVLTVSQNYFWRLQYKIKEKYQNNIQKLLDIWTVTKNNARIHKTKICK